MSLLDTRHCGEPTPHTAHKWPTDQPARYGCPGAEHHAPAHRDGHTTDVCVCTPDEARELARLRQTVDDLLRVNSIANRRNIKARILVSEADMNPSWRQSILDALDGAE